MRRVTAMFVALAAVAAGSLAIANPAGAAAPGPSPACQADPVRRGEVNCKLLLPEDRDVTSIIWYIDHNRIESSGQPFFSFSCAPAVTYRISYDALISPPPPPGGEEITGFTNFTCPGARISNVYAGCSSGGSRLQCSVTWTGGTPPVSIRWTVNGALRTFFNDQWWMDISCNAPSVMSISVTVSDAYSGQTASGYCSCHSGPLD